MWKWHHITYSEKRNRKVLFLSCLLSTQFMLMEKYYALCFLSDELWSGSCICSECFRENMQLQHMRLILCDRLFTFWELSQAPLHVRLMG